MSPEALARCGGALVISLAVALGGDLAQRLAIRHRILSTPTERGVHEARHYRIGGIGILGRARPALTRRPRARLVIGAICGRCC